MTAGFMVGAIEESLALEIGAGRAAEVERLLPDLSHLVVLNYFGEDEAWLELRSADAAPRHADLLAPNFSFRFQTRAVYSEDLALTAQVCKSELQMLAKHR